MKRYWFATVCMLMLANCSMIDHAYNKAPAFVASELDEAFDLNESQSNQLDSRLEQFFTWHRKEELGRYQQLLERASRSTADGITAADFLKLNDDIRIAWRRSLAKAIDSLGDLALTLNQEQIEHYQRYYRERSEEHRDYLEMSAQQREIYRVGRSFDLLEKWFGKFNFSQEDRVMARLQQVPDFYEPWIRYQEARQQALVSALRNATETGLTPQDLKTILLNPSTKFARNFEPARRSYWQAYAAALEDISFWLTTSQRQKAVDKLQLYARIAARLNSEG